jgi:hypothetical protein
MPESHTTPKESPLTGRVGAETELLGFGIDSPVVTHALLQANEKPEQIIRVQGTEISVTFSPPDSYTVDAGSKE